MKITIKERDPEPIENIFYIGNVVVLKNHDDVSPVLVTGGVDSGANFSGIALSPEGPSQILENKFGKDQFEQFHGTITLEAGS